MHLKSRVLMLEIAGVDPAGFDVRELFEMVHEEFMAGISPNQVTLILWRFWNA